MKKIVRSRSNSGIILKISISTGLMNLVCSRVTTESSAICLFLSIEQGVSVVLVTLAATFL